MTTPPRPGVHPAIGALLRRHAVETAGIHARRALVHDRVGRCPDTDPSPEDRAHLRTVVRHP